MIVFGWGRRTRKDNGPVVLVTCPQCNNNSVYRWISTKTWFTLFFIPLIPYNSRQFLLCPICSNARLLSGEEVHYVAAMIPHTQRAIAGEGDMEAYAQETAAFWNRLSGASPTGVNSPGLAVDAMTSADSLTWSEDRRYWWDNNTWIDAERTAPPGVSYAEDGRWWDGQSWRANPQSIQNLVAPEETAPEIADADSATESPATQVRHD